MNAMAPAAIHSGNAGIATLLRFVLSFGGTSMPSLSEWSGVSPETDPLEAAEWIPEVARAIALIEEEVARSVQ